MRIKKRKILIMLFICIMVLGVLLLLLKRIENSKIEEYKDSFEELAQEYYKQEKIVPQNFTPLMREYIGEVGIQEWYSHIYKFVDYYIPEIHKSKNMLNYYNKNYLDIKTDLGIDSYDEFELLANEINNVSESATFKDSEFDATTIDSRQDLISVDFNIFFSNNEELNLKFIVYNEIKDDISISILSN